MIYSYPINPEDCKIFSAKEKFTAEEVKIMMESFSSGKVKKTRVGKLSIVNCFIPKIKESLPELLVHEGSYVFYAVDKFSTGFFSKASVRMLIWAPISKNVFAVPVDAVSFEKPDNGTKQEVFITEEGEEHPITKKSDGDGKEHVCYFKKIELRREFVVEEKLITATKDILHHHFRWTNPDYWVKEHFKIVDSYDPMYFLRHEIMSKEIPGWSVQISYPREPNFSGFHVDE